MEIKKSKNANLEKKRSTFLLIGMVLSLAFVWMSFEYKSYEPKQDYTQLTSTDMGDEDIIIQTKAAEPVKPPPVKVFTNMIEVDNNIDVPDINIDVETGDDDEIEAQIIEDEIEDEVEEPIFVFVEKNASFPGGDKARLKFLKENIEYPVMAIESGIQGTVYITFVVEKDGSISHVELLRGIGGGCDEEAIRVIKNMPKWNPGEQRMLPVRVQMNIPIKFNLD